MKTNIETIENENGKSFTEYSHFGTTTPFPRATETPSTAYLEEDERGEHGPQARARAGVARVEECEHADQNRRRDVGARPGVGMVRLWGRCRML